MASPFDVEPPRWLTNLAKPADTSVMAKDIGMVFGGAMLGMQADPDKESVFNEETQSWEIPKKGFQKGLTEARMNQQDPQWKVKESALTAQAAGNWARAATSWQDYNNKASEDALWATKDLPALTQWREELKKDPEAVAPIMESTKGHAAVQQVESGMLKNEAMRLRQENSRIQVDNQRRSVDWDNAIGTAPADVQSQIAELPNQGWTVNNGRRISPTTQALSIYNQWATDGNKNPDRAFGYKSNPVTAAKTRASPSGKSEPEFFIDPQTNRRFMRWGNKHYDLSGVTPQQRAEIEVAKADYNRAQKEYDKIVSTPEPSDAKSSKKYLEQKESLMQNIFTTRDNLSKLTKGAPSTSAPATPTSTPKIFTDKSGKKFNYKGNASDPSTDKNPSNWEVIP